jgi:serine/threonine-protein kinase RsbT
MGKSDITVSIKVDADIVTARQEGRSLANHIGFSGSDQVLIATAISEAARNILQYARSGEIVISRIQNGEKGGIQVIARDQGPGIKDIRRVMEDGYSSAGGLGLGLPGIKRLMNEMEIQSTPGKGTTITFRKWKV